MKFIHSDRTAASYTIIGKYIVNTNTHQIAKFRDSADAISRGVIDIPNLEKLTEAYKSSPGDFRNITNNPYTIDQLLDETNGNTFLLSVIAMESEDIKTLKSLVNYENGEIVCNMINDNYMVHIYPSLVDMIIKKYVDDKQVLSAFVKPQIIDELSIHTINRLYELGDPDITYSLIAYDILSKKDLEPLFESDNITILKALAQFAPLNESQRETFLHHSEEDVWLAFRRRDDIRPEEDKYLWDRVIESQREYEAEMERQREIKRQERLELEKKIEMELAAERQQAGIGIGTDKNIQTEHTEPTIFKP